MKKSLNEGTPLTAVMVLHKGLAIEVIIITDPSPERNRAVLTRARREFLGLNPDLDDEMVSAFYDRLRERPDSDWTITLCLTVTKEIFA